MPWQVWLMLLLIGSSLVSGIVIILLERKPPIDPLDIYRGEYDEE